MASNPLLIRLTGADRSGITADILGIAARADAEVHDLEQVVVRERLTLDILLGLDEASESLVKDVLYWGHMHGFVVEFEWVEPHSKRADLDRQAITVMAPAMSSKALAEVTGEIAACGGNLDRIVRLATQPVVAYDLQVIGTPHWRQTELRQRLIAVAQRNGIDVAVQQAGIERRSKRLVVMDVDSTFIQNEVIELLAAEAGCEPEVADITHRAMAGELDFTQTLHQRVALLRGLDASALERARDKIQLTPGARTFVRTLQRMGCQVAILSGGFSYFTDWLQSELALDHAFANELEIEDGVLTGRVIGPIIDRPRKAELLRTIAGMQAIPLSQVVAIGDGANDIDMLSVAGLGIAFNAKQVVRERADATVSVPQLDSVLFMLGIRSEDIR